MKFLLFFLPLAVLLPGHYGLWRDFNQQVLTAVVGASLAVALVRAGGVGRWGFPRPAQVALLLALVMFFSFAIRENVYVSDLVLSALYLGIFALFVGMGFRTSEGYGRNVVDAYWSGWLFVAVASVFIQLMQWQGITWLGIWINDYAGWGAGRPYGNLAQPNQLAVVQCLGLVALARLSGRRHLGAGLSGLMGLLLLCGITMTQSRGGLVLAFLVALYAGFVSKGALLNGRHWLGLVCVAPLLPMAWVWVRLNDALYFSVGFSDIQARVRDNGRQLNWPALWHAIQEKPWSGWGWQRVSEAQSYAASHGYPSFEQIANSHNIVLDLMIWAGVPVAMVVSGYFVWWFLDRTRKARDRDSAVMLSGVLVIGGYAMVEYPLEYLYFLMPLGLMVGFVEHGLVYSVVRIKWYSVPAVLVVMLSIGGWVVAEYLVVNEADYASRMALARMGSQAGERIPAPDVVLLDAHRDFHDFRFSLARPGMSDADLYEMRRVVDRFPIAPALFRMALAEALNGNPKAAEARLKALCNTAYARTCDEAAENWRALGERFVDVRAVSMPSPTVRFMPSFLPPGLSLKGG